MLIVQSQSMDVYRNLALEEYLMDRVADCGPVLFLWRSDCAVVLGKNQNPWRECRLDLMRADDVPLARRISGGGTVYHDEGNLNYCIMTSREAYREEQAYAVVFQALETYGIRAEKTGKSNLSVGGRKFSGNAFAFRRGRALHHGTLLLNTDLKRLGRYLGSMFDHIDTHAIASVPAAVMNLQLDVAELSGRLVEAFRSVYDDGVVFQGMDGRLDEAVVEQLVDRQLSSDWKFCSTPGFVLEKDGAVLKVVKGVVVRAEGCGAECYEGMAFENVAFSLFC